MHQVFAVIALSAATIIALGISSRRLQRAPLSRPLLAMAIGAGCGPAGLALVSPEAWADPHGILKEAARFTLAISVTGIALRTPASCYRAQARPVLLLGFGMVSMWAVSAGLAFWLAGLAPLMALLVGAIVMPTDPVVASSVVTGAAAEATLPLRTRAALSLESGANDGLAYPAVMLPLLAMTTAGWQELWLIEALWRGVILSVALGAALGATTAFLLHRADKAGWIAQSSMLGLALALAMLNLAAARLVGGDGILAAFAGGIAFNMLIDRDEELAEENVTEAISKLFNLPVFLLFGLMLPWQGWAGLGAGGLLTALGIVLLRRPIAVAPLAAVLGGGMRRRDVVFLGWFGPVGVAAIFYALEARHRSGDDTAWIVASLVVALSVLIHGLTSGPGLRLYGRAATR